MYKGSNKDLFCLYLPYFKDNVHDICYIHRCILLFLEYLIICKDVEPLDTEYYRLSTVTLIHFDFKQ